MNVEHIYRPDVVAIDVRDSVADAASRMQYDEVGSLVVFDGEDFVGILTERDIVRAVAEDADPGWTPVGAYMTERPFVATLDMTSDQAIAKMVNLGVRHLPVVLGGKVVGMISARDLLTDPPGA